MWHIPSLCHQAEIKEKSESDNEIVYRCSGPNWHKTKSDIVSFFNCKKIKVAQKGLKHIIVRIFGNLIKF